MDLSDAIDCIRPSVVQFCCHYKDTDDRHPFGSGFIVDENGHVATAAHVVQSAESILAAGHEVTIGLAYPNFDHVDFGEIRRTSIRDFFYDIGADLVAHNAAYDVAVLRMNPNPFESPPQQAFRFAGQPGPQPLYGKCCVSTDRPRDGAEVAVSGYPLRMPTLITTGGHLASSWLLDEVEIQEGTSQKRCLRDRYLADISVNPGNSGGPAFRLSDGCVIGVCTAYQNAPVFFCDNQDGPVKVDNRPIAVNAGLAVVTPIRWVLDLLAGDQDTHLA